MSEVSPDSSREVAVEPLPETEEALAEYLEVDDEDLRQTLIVMSMRARAIVPTLVGFSLGLVKDALTFTLVATSDEISALDAVQYADDGPCEAVLRGEALVIDVDVQDFLDEGRWSAYAAASAHDGVLSSLSLPIHRQGRLIGGINLYAATRGAFHDKHQVLSEALHATAGAAVTDADLDFTTRALARSTPTKLNELRIIDVATGVLAAQTRTDVESARLRLEEAAVRADVSIVQAARVFTRLGGLDLT
jgi:GAF domain-containing protein